MAKKIVKAIILVEIDEEEEGLSRMICRLENGTSMVLNREQVFIPPPPEKWVDSKDQSYNLPVTC
jgi:hypothetical protein